MKPLGKLPLERNYEFDIFIFGGGAISKSPAGEIFLLTILNLAEAIITRPCETKTAKYKRLAV